MGPVNFRVGLSRALVVMAAPLLVTCNGQPAGYVAKLPPGPPAAVTDSNLGAAPNGGGCYPAPVTGDLLTQQLNQVIDINPHWAPVVGGARGPEADPIVIHGIAHGSHGDTGGDFPSDHGTSDATSSIELDAADRGYLGTGNGSGADARLEIEWESGKWPDWAWPGDGDRIIAMGRWIFDCGHNGAEAGKCSATASQACTVDSDCIAPACPGCAMGERCMGAKFAYQTEMHPPHATAVIRAGRGGLLTDGAKSAAPITRADVFVSGDGGTAADRCAMTHQDPYTDLIFSEDCYPLAEPLARLDAYDFAFDVPLPARPVGAGDPVWRWVPRLPAPSVAADSVVEAHASDAAPHLSVIVKMAAATSGGAMPTGFAGTLVAGWSGDATPMPPMTHVRLTVDGIDVQNPIKPATPVVRAADGWALQMSVNGEFQRLAGLDGLNAPATIAQSLVFDQYLPAGGALALAVDGTSRKCIDTMFGKALRTSLHDLQLQGMIDCLQTTNDPNSPGSISASFAGPDFGAGGGSMSYTLDAKGSDGGTCAGTGALCVTDRDCANAAKCTLGGAAFKLRFHIERLP